ncbi:MAG: AIR synthase-related protein, partial [Anaerolineales bacterium]
TMVSLNKAAAEAMGQVKVNACTDITGFGLIGHLLEMMNGSGTSAIIENAKVPFLPQVDAFAAANIIPGGTRDNDQYTKSSVSYASKISESRQLMLNDAQTSGGLLISVPKNRADKLLKLMQERGIKDAVIIGRVVSRSSPVVRVE